jgi:hypothetical protein
MRWKGICCRVVNDRVGLGEMGGAYSSANGLDMLYVYCVM